MGGRWSSFNLPEDFSLRQLKAQEEDREKNQSELPAETSRPDDGGKEEG